MSADTFSVRYSVKFKQEQAHDDSIWSCAWGVNEKSGTEYVVTGSLDDKVKIWKWNADHLEPLHVGEGHHLGVLSVDVNRAGTLAASSSLDSQVRVWDLESGKQYRYIDAGPVDAWTLAFSPDSRYLASGSHTGNVHLFGVESGKKESSLPLDGKFTLSIAYSPDGTKLAAGAVDGIISIIDLPTKKILPLEGHAMPVRCLAFSPDGRLLVSVSDDFQIKVYDVQHGSLVCTLSGHSSWVVSVAFNPDNQHFATCSADKTVRVWDISAKSHKNSYFEHNDQVWCVRYNPSGTKLASVGDDKLLVVYDCPQ